MSQGFIQRGATLRATVTTADLNYVGSSTVHAMVCDAAGLADQQMIKLQNERTGAQWFTYIIRAEADSGLPRDVISMNGPAAYFAKEGDVVTMSSPTTVPLHMAGSFVPPKPVDIVGRNLYKDPLPKTALPPKGLVVQKCIGKMHRIRVTSFTEGGATPEVFIDEDWLDESGLPEFTNVTVANVNTGARIEACVRKAKRGSRRADVVKRGELGCGKFNVGDVIIVMAYAECDWRDLMADKEPEIKVSFPFEKPIFQPAPPTENGLNVEQIKKATM